MKVFLLILSVGLILSSFTPFRSLAQIEGIPDYNTTEGLSVLIETLDKHQKDGTYESLKTRLAKLDTTLTEAELFYLRFGATRADDYSGYLYGSVRSSNINKLDGYLKSQKAEVLIKEASNYITMHTNDPIYILFLQAGYQQLGQIEAMKASNIIYQNYNKAMLVSKSGTKTTEAWLVTGVWDEYFIVSQLGAKVSTQALVIDKKSRLPYDKITIRNASGGEKNLSLYFNIGLFYGKF
ncbi:MAG: DUF4919 domain-containing protein [Bacteroidia bacterium]|nr:DUF4919 domain-containing protein [Bacteroidia bacterium]